MKIRNVLIYPLFCLISFLVIFEIYCLVFPIGILIYSHVTGQIISVSSRLPGLINFSLLICGIYVGIRACRRKNLFYRIFYPHKISCLISLLLSVIVVSFVHLTFKSSDAFVVNTTFQVLHPSFMPFLAVISYFAIFYPFSALLYFIYNRSHRVPLQNKFIPLLILLILINPVFAVVFTSLNSATVYLITHRPCGAIYYGFTNDSAAKDAGMLPGETIVRIDNITVKTAKDLITYLNEIRYEKNVTIETDRSIYNLKLRFNTSSGKYQLGIRDIRTKLCKID